jgi:uncharacterized sulfatase
MGLLLLLSLLLSPLSLHAQTKAERRPNILFIVADDLNNNLGCYGHEVVRSPGIDRLAKRGVRFDRAYCQYPVCNPSRTSFLSGLRPAKTQIIDNVTPTRTYLADHVFLPQFFRQQGYRTIKVGKIFHTGAAFEDPASWDVDMRETKEAKNPPEAQILREANLEGKKAKGEGRGIVLNADDADTWDGKVARWSVGHMEKAAKGGQPFFLAVGFRRPHAPYIAPKKYADLYAPAKMPVPEEPAEHLAKIPALALTYKPSGAQLKGAAIASTRAAYWASISFMDAQVGVLLDALDRLGLADNTIIVFISDHGYHLGEHGGLWHKMTLFEEAARLPMIVAAPGKSAGRAAPGLVELIDLYPTLTELCGLKAPAGLDGASFVPLLADPERAGKRAVYTELSRGGTAATSKLSPDLMGRSVRTARWRYTEWDNGKQGLELYDHDGDPREYRNLSQEPAYADVVREHRELLRALPPVPASSK